MERTQASRARFGSFELDLRAGELHSNGDSALLPDQVFQVLCLLVERGGDLVTREELKSKLWPNDTVVEFDHGINNTIKRLRKFLNDSAEEPRYIETIPRRGYRLMVPVEWVSAGDSSGESSGDASRAAIHKSRLIGIKVSHYRVLEVIGGGGMGMVYEAEDLKLGRRVALKFLPEELATDSVALQRFEREAHTASSLNHPNICTIYEVEEYEGRPFIVMELLEGETLRERLAASETKALRLDQLLDIGLQICEGLQAAHGKGIIHRDIKPANMFITEKNVAKILDFGVAKVIETSEAQEFDAGDGRKRLPSSLDAAGLTRTGLKLGTAGYMSPEQVRGEPLDQRTDIFSFGLVLYEMATGERAFTGETEAVLHDAIVNCEPKPVRELAPELSPRLEQIITTCLEKQKELRYQTVSELSAELKKLRGKRDRVASRRPWLWAASLLLVVLLAGTLVTWRRQRMFKLTSTDTIVLGEFSNSTGDPLLDKGLKIALEHDLAQTPYLNLLSIEKVTRALKQIGKPANAALDDDTAQHVCSRTNSRAVIAGSIADAGNQYQIILKARDCRTGREVAGTEAAAGDRNQIIAQLGAAGHQLRVNLGESELTLRDFNIPLERNMTTSLEALDAYARTMPIRFTIEAIPLLTRAVELDPQFAIAYADLGTTYVDVVQWKLAQQSLTKAYELRDRVDRRSRLLIEGGYYFQATGQLEKALGSSQALQQTYPNALAWNQISFFNRKLGRYEESVSAALKAKQETPDSFRPYVNLEASLRALNHFEQARRTLDEAKARNVDDWDLHAGGYLLSFLEGDSVGMQNNVRWSAGMPGIEDVLLDMQASTDAYYGRFNQAHQTWSRAVELSQMFSTPEQTTGWILDEALSCSLVGNISRAKELTRQALALSAWRPVLAAETLAVVGDTTQSKALANALDHDFPVDTFIQNRDLPTIRALTLIHDQQPQEAINILQTAKAYERTGSVEGFGLYAAYVRGEAYLHAGHATQAAEEFQRVLNDRSIVANFVIGALAYLQLARAQAMMGDKVAARKSYEDFLTLWKDADPDIPIYKQAKAEYANIH
jgi:serine/threonine protein kinase/tetratricopeptide (TPR) repeat protein